MFIGEKRLTPSGKPDPSDWSDRSDWQRNQAAGASFFAPGPGRYGDQGLLLALVDQPLGQELLGGFGDGGDVLPMIFPTATGTRSRAGRELLQVATLRVPDAARRGAGAMVLVGVQASAGSSLQQLNGPVVRLAVEVF